MKGPRRAVGARLSTPAVNPLPADTTPPAAPGTPVVSNVTFDGSATVTFAAATDNIAVLGYAAFLDGSSKPVATSSSTTINLKNIPAGSHSVTVAAYDAAGNYSALSLGTVFSMPSKIVKPVLVDIGDSINAGQNAILSTGFTASGSGNIGTFSGLGSTFLVGETIFVSGYANEEWNGEKTIKSSSWNGSSSTVTFESSTMLTASPSVAPDMVVNILIDARTNDRCFIHHVNYDLGCPFTVKNRAISGTMTPFTLSRLVSDVFSASPAVVYDDSGINDVLGGTIPEATTIANIRSIATQVTAFGAEYWRAEITPINDTGSLYTLLRKKSINRINQALRQMAETIPGFYLIPANALMTNKSTGVAISSYWTDATGVHPIAQAMNQIRKLITSLMSSRWSVPSKLVTDGLTSYNTDSNSKVAVRNPLMLGSQVTGNTGTSGNVPLNCNVSWDVRAGSGVVACSVVPRSDGYGNNLQMVLSGATADGDRLRVEPVIDKAAFINGDVVRMSMSVTRTGVSGLRGIPMMLFTGAWVDYVTTGGDPGNNFGSYTDDGETPIYSVDFIWNTAALAAANSLVIWILFSAAAAGTFAIGRVNLEKVG